MERKKLWIMKLVNQVASRYLTFSRSIMFRTVNMVDSLQC